MVRPMFYNIVVILFSIYPVKGTFNACANYILTSAFFDSPNHGFKSQTGDNKLTTTGEETTSWYFSQATITCSSIYMNNADWNIKGDYSGCKSKSEFGIGFWASFEATTTPSGYTFMLFGTSSFNSDTHSVVSPSDGQFTLKALGISDLSFSVNMNKWTFLVFHWTSSTFEVYAPGFAVATGTKTGDSYLMPTSGVIYFGYKLKAKFYQIIGFDKVSNYESNTIITLSDGTNDFIATATPTGICSDTVMHPTQNCLSQTSDCSACDTGTFTCKTCALPYEKPSRFCNVDFYCPSGCFLCSSSTLCTQCMTNYFLYDNAGTTGCISCDTSCHDCNPGPGCFECASAIAQDGSTCRVDKVGFQIGFSYPNIEIDFAHKLTSTLTINSLTAITEHNVHINTDQWTLNSCAAGSSSCVIVTDNLSESQLPLDLNFQFLEA